MPRKQGTLSILGVITYYWFANGNEVNLGHSSYRFILEIGVKVLVCMSESHRKRKRCEFIGHHFWKTATKEKIPSNAFIRLPVLSSKCFSFSFFFF